MVVVTGVGGAEALLRDGSGGVGGRYVCKNYHHLQHDANTRYHTNFGSTRYRGCRLIRGGGDP